MALISDFYGIIWLISVKLFKNATTLILQLWLENDVANECERGVSPLK